MPFTTGAGFVVTDPLNPATAGPARFIFAAEDGSISGWPGGVDHAIVAVPPSAAVYKGLAIVSTTPGNVAGDFLYATNFRGGVDVFNSAFVKQPAGRFVDPTIPADYGPFGIQKIGDKVYVTYALRDEDGEDDVPGMGHGFVNAFDLGRPARQWRIQASRHAAQRGRPAAGDRGSVSPTTRRVRPGPTQVAHHGLRPNRRPADCAAHRGVARFVRGITAMRHGPPRDIFCRDLP